MQKLYWRPREISRMLLVLIALAAAGAVAAVESFKLRNVQPFNSEKLAAAGLCAKAFTVIKQERIRRNLPVSREFDPAQSGLIGPSMTSVTTVSGALTAKQTTANPNWAAVMVHYLKRLKLKEGDTVAVGYSGSFPAINICVLAAMRTLKLKPILISSVGASGFGANMPRFLWIDMEKALADKGLWPYRSTGASLGGIGDRAQGMREDGRERIIEAIKSSGVTYIETKSYEDGVERRMQLFAQQAGEQPIKAYINVGGGTLSVGTSVGKHLYNPGLNRRPPPGALAMDSVMTRFMKQDIPLIHITNISILAERWGLPIAPRTMPKPGEGKIYTRHEYNPYLTAAALALLLGALFIFIRTEWGQRILLSASMGDRKPPEPSI